MKYLRIPPSWAQSKCHSSVRWFPKVAGSISAINARRNCCVSEPKRKKDFSIIWWSWDDDDKYFRPRSSFCCHFLKLNVTFKNFWILIFFHNRFETTKNFDTVHIVTINWNSDGSAMTLSQEKKQNERRSHHFKMFRRHSKSMQDYSHMQMTFAFKMNISARSILFKGSSRWLLSVKSIITTYTEDFSLKGSLLLLLTLQFFASSFAKA